MRSGTQETNGVYSHSHTKKCVYIECGELAFVRNLSVHISKSLVFLLAFYTLSVMGAACSALDEPVETYSRRAIPDTSASHTRQPHDLQPRQQQQRRTPRNCRHWRGTPEERALERVQESARELFDAVRRDRLRGIARWLAGTSPNMRSAVLAYGDADGCTALHCASFYGNPRAAALLIDAGAKPSATDDYGRTPCYYANAQLGKIPHSDYQLMLDILCCPRMNLSATIAAEVRQRHGLERAPPLVTGIAAPEGPGGGRDIVHGVRVR